MGQNAGKYIISKYNFGYFRKVSKVLGDGFDFDLVDISFFSQSLFILLGFKYGMVFFFRKQSDVCKKRMDYQLYLVSYQTIVIKIILVFILVQ